MSEQDGGPAFPEMDVRSTHDNDGRGDMNGIETETYGGMSLRDYFAGQALAGLCAAIHRGGDGYWPTVILDCDGFAADAYSLADAMLKERNG